MTAELMTVQLGGHCVSYDRRAVTFGKETQLPDLASKVQGRSAAFASLTAALCRHWDGHLEAGAG